MNEYITSYLIQTRACTLPGLGTFTLHQKPARYDVTSKEMAPPVTEVAFSEVTGEWDSDFLGYVSHLRDTDADETREVLLHWIADVKARLEAGGEEVFPTLGTLRNTNGVIEFQNVPHTQIYQKVRAERVVRKEAKHQVLVGDKETTNTEMNDFLHQANTTRIYGNRIWKIAAAILLLVGLGALGYHFYHHHSLANETPIVPKNPPNTYIER